MKGSEIMNFKELDDKTKKQIKASMKRVCSNVFKLNIDNLDKVTSSTIYSSWTSRYISSLGKKKFYNLIELDPILEDDLMCTMDTIYNRELLKLENKDLAEYSESVKNSEKQNHRFKEATSKQIYYASYLMNMVRNRPLPKRKYTMSEIGSLINTLKKQLKV